MSYFSYSEVQGKLSSAALACDPDRSAALRLTPKRLYDAVFSFCGLVLLSPLFLVIGALVKIADGGDIFFRQLRVGQGGRPFWIYKFRTMKPQPSGPQLAVTKDRDPRITRVGRFLRKAKLDELPQLWNVLRGDMSLVGPRPEVPRYVQHYTPEQRTILQHKPGITDLASLCFRDEEALLAHADNVEEFYLQQCVPRKLQLNKEYAERANLWSDTWIILQTICPYWAGVLACYSLILATAFGLASGLLHDFVLPDWTARPWGWELGVLVGFQLGFLVWRKQCQGLLSYFSFLELRQVSIALGLATVGQLAWSAVNHGQPAPNLILLDGLLSFLLLCGFRVVLRRWRERAAGAESDTTPAQPPARVGIIGAGGTGAQVALELMRHRHRGRVVVAFFDDDFHKWRKHIHDVPVVGMPECLLEGWTEKLDEVVIALPGAPADRLCAIYQMLRKASLKSYTVSSPLQLREWPQAA